MKRLPILSLIVLLFIAADISAQSTDITIIHTNDMHSRMLGFSPNSDYTPYSLNDDATRGGMARIKTIMDTIRSNEENVLLVDAGDFLMGTVFQTMEPQTGFQLRLMEKIGWDVVAIGNHEFDFGIDGLTDIITAANTLGEIPPLLLSNINFSDSLPDDDGLKELFDNGIITSYHIEEVSGLKIAFFSLLGKDAYEVAPYAKPLTTKDQAETAVKMNEYLRSEHNADIVIALSHSGVFTDDEGNYILEDVEVANACPGLDLIVSGHTHTFLKEPLVVNGVPIVQTGAYTKNLGKTVLTYNNGETQISNFEMIPVDDSWLGNYEIQNIVENQMEVINKEILFGLGLRADSLIVETSFPLSLDEDILLKNSNLGPFIADAVYEYYHKLNEDVDFTLVAAGLLRDDIIPGAKGMQYATDLYRVLPLGRGSIDKNSPGYSLAKIYVTGNEIKSILEIMQIAPSLSTSNMPYWSGIRYSTHKFRAPLDNIYEVEIRDPYKGWQKINLSKKDETLYSLGANAYLLEFVGMIKDLSKGILKVTPKNKNGEPINGVDDALIDLDKKVPGIQEAKEWAALMDFCAGFTDINGNNIPDIPAEYKLENMLVHKDGSTFTDDSLLNDLNPDIKNLKSPVKEVTASPLKVFKSGNGVTLVLYAIVVVILTLLFLLIRWIVRKIRK